MADNEMTQEDYLSEICHQLGELTDIKKLLNQTNQKLDLMLSELKNIDRHTKH
jgi:hypothetical protein